MPFRNPGRRNQFREEIDEAVHLRTAGDGASQALVRLAGFPLSILLTRPSLPVVGDCPPGMHRQITQDVVTIHGHAVSDSSHLFNTRTQKSAGT
jgi:hypothetical protein